MVEGIAEVDGKEVGRGSVVEAVGDVVEGLADTLEGFVVAGIGEEHIILAWKFLADSGEHGVAKDVKAEAGLC